MDTECSFCNHRFPISSERCPHCAQPGLFPNVELAKLNDEMAALKLRYNEAFDRATARGCDNVFKDFETCVTNDSKAVICRTLNETVRLANSDRDLYSTYYKEIDAESRLPHGTRWDKRRLLTDNMLFPNFHESIRFAALSLNRTGLKNYGECSWTLRTEMIEHRTSVFEENSVVFMINNDIKIDDSDDFPKGHRASWSNRGKIAALKLVNRMQESMPKETYAGILVVNASKGENDEFIEVHIWGPISIRTIENITVKKPIKRTQKLFVNDLKNKLKRYGVGLKVI